MAKFIVSKSKIQEQFERIAEVSDIVSYSSKTNPLITPILEKTTNALFSIHLKNELIHIKNKKRVIFLSQGLTSGLLEELTLQGIDFFVVDNEPDLDVLLAFIEQKDIKIRLLLRMKLREHSIRTEKYFVFGMSSEVITKKIMELKKNPLISEIGVHFHRKTQNMSEWNYRYELEQSLEEDVLKQLDFVNIGGGFPSEYANTNVDVISSIIKKTLEIKVWLNKFNIKLIVEPGRFIAAPSLKLETNIIRVYDNNIIIDASVYNSDLDALIVPVKLKVEDELKKGEGEPFVIKGVTPCSMDLFRYRVYLKEAKEGQKITFLNAGAYNFSTNFCDLDSIEVEVGK